MNEEEKITMGYKFKGEKRPPNGFVACVGRGRGKREYAKKVNGHGSREGGKQSDSINNKGKSLGNPRGFRRVVNGTWETGEDQKGTTEGKASRWGDPEGHGRGKNILLRSRSKSRGRKG